MNIHEYEGTFRRDGTLQYQYFQILKDCEWHCRKCAAKIVDSEQLAGGGGVGGLRRGSRGRPGINIVSEIRTCPECGSTGKWDRWNGTFKNANAASGLPKKLQARILKHYKYIDVIEQRVRQVHALVIDHRFPMERWGEAEPHNPVDMSEDEIERRFQLLKKDDFGNHNLLKSRACERCLDTGKRGYPLGIKFYYGNTTEDWPPNCPPTGADAEEGCKGCGWYDFAAWRKELNEFIEANGACIGSDNSDTGK